MKRPRPKMKLRLARETLRRLRLDELDRARAGGPLPVIAVDTVGSVAPTECNGGSDVC